MSKTREVWNSFWNPTEDSPSSVRSTARMVTPQQLRVSELPSSAAAPASHFSSASSATQPRRTLFVSSSSSSSSPLSDRTKILLLAGGCATAVASAYAVRYLLQVRSTWQPLLKTVDGDDVEPQQKNGTENNTDDESGCEEETHHPSCLSSSSSSSSAIVAAAPEKNLAVSWFVGDCDVQCRQKYQNSSSIFARCWDLLPTWAKLGFWEKFLTTEEKRKITPEGVADTSCLRRLVIVLSEHCELPSIKGQANSKVVEVGLPVDGQVFVHTAIESVVASSSSSSSSSASPASSSSSSSSSFLWGWMSPSALVSFFLPKKAEGSSGIPAGLAVPQAVLEKQQPLQHPPHRPEEAAVPSSDGATSPSSSSLLHQQHNVDTSVLLFLRLVFHRRIGGPLASLGGASSSSSGLGSVLQNLIFHSSASAGCAANGEDPQDIRVSPPSLGVVPVARYESISRDDIPAPLVSVDREAKMIILPSSSGNSATTTTAQRGGGGGGGGEGSTSSLSSVGGSGGGAFVVEPPGPNDPTDVMVRRLNYRRSIDLTVFRSVRSSVSFAGHGLSSPVTTSPATSMGGGGTMTAVPLISLYAVVSVSRMRARSMSLHLSSDNTSSVGVGGADERIPCLPASQAELILSKINMETASSSSSSSSSSSARAGFRRRIIVAGPLSNNCSPHHQTAQDDFEQHFVFPLHESHAEATVEGLERSVEAEAEAALARSRQQKQQTTTTATSSMAMGNASSSFSPVSPTSPTSVDSSSWNHNLGNRNFSINPTSPTDKDDGGDGDEEEEDAGAFAPSSASKRRRNMDKKNQKQSSQQQQQHHHHHAPDRMVFPLHFEMELEQKQYVSKHDVLSSPLASASTTATSQPPPRRNAAATSSGVTVTEPDDDAFDEDRDGGRSSSPNHLAARPSANAGAKQQQRSSTRTGSSSATTSSTSSSSRPQQQQQQQHGYPSSYDNSNSNGYAATSSSSTTNNALKLTLCWSTVGDTASGVTVRRCNVKKRREQQQQQQPNENSSSSSSSAGAMSGQYSLDASSVHQLVNCRDTQVKILRESWFSMQIPVSY